MKLKKKVAKGKVPSMKEKIRKRAETHRSAGGMDTLRLPDGVDLLKLEKGKMEFSIIPYKVTADNHPEVSKGDLWYERYTLSTVELAPRIRLLFALLR